MGKRLAGTPKKKSIKSKAINKNSKRKLDTLGKKQKKGYAGEVVMYMNRTQALRKLGLSLKDFRRICILKGIYPRDPKKKPNTSMTYYHVKDIAYISHEPIIDYFRKMKTFMKKLSRANGRNETSEALRKWEHKPEMNLDHLVKERYPTFASALTDMDDALSMINLFAFLPATNGIKSLKTAACKRLAREWNYYVIESRSLRKAFISIKGIYYQAEVCGEKVTWLVPHKFSQSMPTDVDFNVMLTFIDFYQVFLQFVLYRLYTQIGLRYPPTFDASKDNQGSTVDAITAEPLSLSPEEQKQQEESKAHVEALTASLQAIPTPEAAEYELEEAFAEDEEARALVAKQKEIQHRIRLLEGKVFFLSREVPRESVELLIRAFGGKIGWEGVSSPFPRESPSITHEIVDRPSIPNKVDNRDYVQPQWLFDSINNGFLLPVEKYAPGVSLPPHLSPFVDNNAEGYTPEYQKEIDRLKEGKMEEEEEEEEVKKEEDGGRFAREIEREAKGEEEEEEKEEEEEEEEEGEEEEKEIKEEDIVDEEKERRIAMMRGKHKRIYRKMEEEAQKKSEKIATLKKKAKKVKDANK